MQRGFLQKESPAKPDGKKEARRAPEPAGGQPGGSAAHAAKPAVSSEQLERGLAECMELLKGPTDERRFVGLLLVTKLLPEGDAETVRRVVDAVGFSFLSRLLLPLRSGAASEAVLAGQDAEGLQKHVGTSALGLAVLASAGRVPELAGSEELLSLLPLFFKVASAGGVTRVIAATSGANVPAVPSTDVAAVVDALECALAVARSGEEGRQVALESGGIGAMAAALRHAGTDVVACPLAVHLLALLLDGSGRGDVIAENEDAVVELVPRLARLLVLPQLALRESEEAKAAAALQLDALHVLLLVLPPPPVAVGLASQLAASAAAGDAWPGQLRAGLSLLLRSRAGAVQRHSALQLAAGLADLAGPEWLLGPGADTAALSEASLSEPPAGPSFFPLVVEVAKVETSVLLLDALAPAAPVPRGAAPGTPAALWVPPEPRPRPARSDDEEEEEAEEADEEALAEMSVGGSQSPPGEHAGAGPSSSSGGGAGAGSEPPLDLDALRRVMESEAEAKAMAARMQQKQAPHLTRQQRGIHEHERQQPGQEQEQEQARMEQARMEHQQPPPYVDMVKRVEEVEVPTDMTWAGPSEPAGDRASAQLPTCFALLEACIEALALDIQAGEEMMESAAAPAPALDDATAQRALASLQEAVEVVLQFVEQSSAAGADAAAHAPLVLAAVRLIGRFCADVPEAFGPRVRALLPFLLSVRSGAEPGQEEAAPGTAPLPDGVCFLLPTLVQVTDPGWADGRGEDGREEQHDWLAALAQPPALSQLVAYTRHAARRCSKSVTEMRAAVCDTGLLFACTVLLQVLAPRGQAWLPDLAPLETEARASVGPVTLAALQVVPSLLEVLASRPIAPPDEATAQQRSGYIRLMSGAAALCAVIVAAAARQLRGTVQPGGALGPLPPETLRHVSKLVLAGMQATCLGLRLPGAGVPLASASALPDLDLEELRGHLELLTTAALSILEVSPVFAAECRQSGWVQAALRAGAAQQPVAGLGEAHAMEGVGLALFFKTLAQLALA